MSVLDSVTTSSSSGSAYRQTAPRKKARQQNRSVINLDFSDDDDEDDLVPSRDGTPAHEVIDGPEFSIYKMDAATREGKRMRNQKKDEFALLNLENVSKGISPREKIYQDGVQRRDREITGAPNSDDGLSDLPGERLSEPLESSSPPKKKRAGRPTGSKNVLRIKASNQRNPKSKYDSSLWHQTYEMVDVDNHPTGCPRGLFVPVYENDDNDGMTYGQASLQRPGGVRIHKDNSGPDITLNNGLQMPTLTSGLEQVALDGAYTTRAQPAFQWGSLGGVSNGSGYSGARSTFGDPTKTGYSAMSMNDFSAAANSAFGANSNTSGTATNINVRGITNSYSGNVNNGRFGPPLQTSFPDVNGVRAAEMTFGDDAAVDNTYSPGNPLSAQSTHSLLSPTDFASFGNSNTAARAYSPNPLVEGGFGRRQARRAAPMAPHTPYVNPNSISRPKTSQTQVTRKDSTLAPPTFAAAPTHMENFDSNSNFDFDALHTPEDLLSLHADLHSAFPQVEESQMDDEGTISLPTSGL